MELKKDLFIINTHSDNFLVYAPLRRAAFYANNKAILVVQKYLENNLSEEDKKTKVWGYIQTLEKTDPYIPQGKDIQIGSNLTIILSQLCNLACSYCYAQKSRSKEILSRDKLQKTIDYILQDRSSENKRFSFIGGGEPTLTWDLLEWAIKYIYSSKKEGQKIHCSIITNGTLLTDERIKFLREYGIYVGISFDILPDIQNAQRRYAYSELKSFDAIHEVVYKLYKYNVNCNGFRSTITKRNVHLMVDMVNFVAENYKNIKYLNFEQVTDIDNNDKEFFENYVENFFKARKIGKVYGIEVYNSISKSVDTLKQKFCSREFCLTPTGDIVSCHRISSNKERNFSSFCIGNVNDQVNINSLQVDKVLNVIKAQKLECEKCFAKWHCAGGCISERLLLSKEQQSDKCNFTKNIIIRILEEKLATDKKGGVNKNVK